LSAAQNHGERSIEEEEEEEEMMRRAQRKKEEGKTYLRNGKIRLVGLIIIQYLTRYSLVDILNITIGEIVQCSHDG